ncbi:MAG: nickel pincer cofactor biosynthesis protein LarC [Acidobacteriota bacterium]
MSEGLLYLDCTAGVSGDMTLGALLDLGVSFQALSSELDKLRVRGVRLKKSRASRSGIRGTRLVVEAPGDAGHRRFPQFRRLIESSRLSPPIKERSLELIRRIYAAEARVHGKRIDKIHLHELGSLDTLVDIVGTLAGLELLGVSRVESSPVNLGGGAVQTEHGLMSVPAPATVLLLKGAPVFSDGSGFERTTPTGALLVSAVTSRFGPWPLMIVERVGYGLGSKDPGEGLPNALRLVLGKRAGLPGTPVLVMETTVDDMSPELAGYLLERLLDAGALDAFVTPVQMKKNRPGVNLTVIAEPFRRQVLAEILFAESTTLGLRWYESERQTLERKLVPVRTRFGRVSVKLGLRDGKVMNIAPEFEECRRIAQARGVSLKAVLQAALAAYQEKERS